VKKKPPDTYDQIIQHCLFDLNDFCLSVWIGGGQLELALGLKRMSGLSEFHERKLALACSVNDLAIFKKGPRSYVVMKEENIDILDDYFGGWFERWGPKGRRI
jgi:hypothetical protein